MRQETRKGKCDRFFFFTYQCKIVPETSFYAERENTSFGFSMLKLLDQIFTRITQDPCTVLNNKYCTTFLFVCRVNVIGLLVKNNIIIGMLQVDIVGMLSHNNFHRLQNYNSKNSPCYRIKPKRMRRLGKVISNNFLRMR